MDTMVGMEQERCFDQSFILCNIKRHVFN